MLAPGHRQALQNLLTTTLVVIIRRGLLRACSPGRHARHQHVAAGDRRPLAAVRLGLEPGRRRAEELGERAAERAEAAEADQVADLGDAEVGPAQQFGRPLDPAAGEVAGRGLAVDRPELAGEVEAGVAGDPGQVVQLERLGVEPVDMITGPAQGGRAAPRSAAATARGDVRESAQSSGLLRDHQKGNPAMPSATRTKRATRPTATITPNHTVRILLAPAIDVTSVEGWQADHRGQQHDRKAPPVGADQLQQAGEEAAQPGPEAAGRGGWFGGLRGRGRVLRATDGPGCCGRGGWRGR